MTPYLFLLAAAAVPNISAGPDLADEALSVDAPIDGVTVFSDRARVRRRAQIQLKGGLHTLALPTIPGAATPGTVRVQIDRGTVLRVEVRPIDQVGVSLPEVEKVLNELLQLGDEQAAIDARVKVYDSELQFLQSTWVSLPVAEHERYGKVRPPLKPQVWKKGLDYIDGRRQVLHTKVREQLKQRRALVNKILLLQAEVNRLDLNAQTRRRKQVFAIVRTPAGNTKLDLIYDLPGARWWPLYELHFSPAQRSVQLNYAGLVQQTTGEDWTASMLSLSTAIPGQAMDLPELLTWTLGERREMIPRPRAETQARQPPSLPAPSPRPSLSSIERDIATETLVKRLSQLQTYSQSDALSLGSQLGAEQVMAFAVGVGGDAIGMAGLSLTGSGIGGGGGAGRASRPPPVQQRPRMREPAARSTSGARYAPEADMSEQMYPTKKSSVSRGVLSSGRRGQARRRVALFDPTQWSAPRFGDRTLPAMLAGGFDYVFESPVRTTIPAGSTQVKVPVSSSRFEVELRYETTPALKKTAYLTARVKNGSRKPILGGKMSIFVDGDFAGEGRLDTTGPGGELVLPLGADEDIRITRHVAPKTREEGFFGKKEITDYEVRIEIANHKKRPVSIDVFDVLPKTNNEKIEIKMVKTTPALANKPDDKGRLRWRLKLAAGQNKKITFTYRIQRPVDWRLVQR